MSGRFESQGEGVELREVAELLQFVDDDGDAEPFYESGPRVLDASLWMESLATQIESLGLFKSSSVKLAQLLSFRKMGSRGLINNSYRRVADVYPVEQGSTLFS